MILSNLAYSQLKREAKAKRHGNLNTMNQDVLAEGKLDWLLFSNLNANETPGQTIVLEE